MISNAATCLVPIGTIRADTGNPDSFTGMEILIEQDVHDWSRPIVGPGQRHGSNTGSGAGRSCPGNEFQR